jgi:hypothetical protein
MTVQSLVRTLAARLLFNNPDYATVSSFESSASTILATPTPQWPITNGFKSEHQIHSGVDDRIVISTSRYRLY